MKTNRHLSHSKVPLRVRLGAAAAVGASALGAGTSAASAAPTSSAVQVDPTRELTATKSLYPVVDRVNQIALTGTKTGGEKLACYNPLTGTEVFDVARTEKRLASPSTRQNQAQALHDFVRDCLNIVYKNFGDQGTLDSNDGTSAKLRADLLNTLAALEYAHDAFDYVSLAQGVRDLTQLTSEYEKHLGVGQDPNQQFEAAKSSYAVMNKLHGALLVGTNFENEVLTCDRGNGEALFDPIKSKELLNNPSSQSSERKALEHFIDNCVDKIYPRVQRDDSYFGSSASQTTVNALRQSLIDVQRTNSENDYPGMLKAVQRLEANLGTYEAEAQVFDHEHNPIGFVTDNGLPIGLGATLVLCAATLRIQARRRSGAKLVD